MMNDIKEPVYLSPMQDVCYSAAVMRMNSDKGIFGSITHSHSHRSLMKGFILSSSYFAFAIAQMEALLY